MKIDELIDILKHIKSQNLISGKDEIFAKNESENRFYLLDSVRIEDNEVEIILK